MMYYKGFIIANYQGDAGVWDNNGDWESCQPLEIFVSEHQAMDWVDARSQ